VIPLPSQRGVVSPALGKCFVVLEVEGEDPLSI
jgi:hypothetical protein